MMKLNINKIKSEKTKKTVRKGMILPTNMMVVIIIAVLIVVVLAVYFSGVVTVSMSEAEAQTTFRRGCMQFCDVDTEQNYINAYIASHEDSDFVLACERLGYGTRDFPNRCFEFCGQNFCNMEVTDNDAEGRRNQLITSLT